MVESELLEYIQRYVPEGVGYLAGNSVHFDKEFMKIEFPKVINWLHYRIIGSPLGEYG
jgi:oligoribonuclease